MSTPVICRGCGDRATVNRVTAGLRHSCGSTDIDLYRPGAEGFLEFMGAAHGPGTGWGKTMPDPLDGWNEYAGPGPGANPMPTPAGPAVCPECEGSKYDLLDKGPCRACKGTGKRTPTTAESPAPQVARHPGQTAVPFMGRRRNAGRPRKDPNAPPTAGEMLRNTVPGWGDQGQRPPENPGRDPYTDESARYPGADSFSPHVRTREPKDYSDEALAKTGPYPMHDAGCPSCGHAPTHLVKDHAEDAWWSCPNCGPLANIDKHPEVNPYADHGENFQPEKGFAGRSARRQNTPGGSRTLTMIASVSATNPGLRQREVVGLVLQTLQRYAG